MDNRAQISLELLIIIAAVLAVAALLVVSLSSSAKSAKSRVVANVKTALNKTARIR